MEVPQRILERMRVASDKGKEFGAQEGVAIARESLSALIPHVQGAYIMPPLGKIELAIEAAAAIPGRKTMAELKGQEILPA